MTQTGIVPTTLPSFPWTQGDELDAVPLNNEFYTCLNLLSNLQNQVNILANQTATGNLGFSMTINWGGNSTPTIGPYELMGTAPYDFTIISADMSLGNNGGSFVFTLLNSGVPVVGLTNVTINQFARTNLIATAAATVLRGSELVLQINSVTGFPMNGWICLNGTTNAIPEPVLGVTTGNASGQSVALAVGTSVTTGSGLALATGTSTAGAQGMAADLSVGTALGSAAGSAHGVQVMVDAGTADATGTSTAQATGTSTTLPTFTMDDPVVGILDQNPLD